MFSFFAYAESSNAASALPTVLICLAVIAGVVLLAMVPVLIAWSRRYKYSQAVLTFGLFWSIFASWNLCTFALAEYSWSSERMLRIESGYFSPADTTGEPTYPVGAWTTLGVSYLALGGWSSIAGKKIAGG